MTDGAHATIPPGIESESGRLHAPEAEISVLGGMIIDDEAIDKVAGLLTPASFRREPHRLLFQAMLQLNRRGEAVDPVTLGEHLSASGQLEQAGGMAYIAELLDVVPTAANIEYHARIVAERAGRRRAHAATAELADRIARELEEGDRDVAELLAWAEGRIVELQRAAVRPGRRLVRDEAVEALPKPEFLIDGFLVRSGLHILAGPPGHGKTFLALDWAYCMATGFRWLGHEVQRGPVVFISAEGHAGLGSRIRAWKRNRQFVGAAAVDFLPEPVNLADPAELGRFLADLRSLPTSPAMIVVDTFSRCFVGDENHQEDVAAFVRGADQLRQKVRAAVLILHHLNASGERERGSTVLRGASDMMAFCKAEDGRITITCEKFKDAPEFPRQIVELKPSGDSCVITPKHAWELTTSADLSTSEREALEALAVGSNTGGLSSTAWLAVSKLPNGTFYRARSRLLDMGYASKAGSKNRDPYVITDEGQAAITPNSQITPNSSHGSAPNYSLPPGGVIKNPPDGSNGPREGGICSIRRVTNDLPDPSPAASAGKRTSPAGDTAVSVAAGPQAQRATP